LSIWESGWVSQGDYHVSVVGRKRGVLALTFFTKSKRAKERSIGHFAKSGVISAFPGHTPSINLYRLKGLMHNKQATWHESFMPLKITLSR